MYVHSALDFKIHFKFFGSDHKPKDSQKYKLKSFCGYK